MKVLHDLYPHKLYKGRRGGNAPYFLCLPSADSLYRRDHRMNSIRKIKTEQENHERQVLLVRTSSLSSDPLDGTWERPGDRGSILTDVGQAYCSSGQGAGRSRAQGAASAKL